MGHYQFVHDQFQMGITKMMLKFACQNLPSKCSTGMTQISLAFGTSMTLLFTKNKQNISDIDKFTYLKLYLCYSANSVISVLTLTSENYFALTLDMSPKMVIETINVKNAMENTMSVFVPFLITKEI